MVRTFILGSATGLLTLLSACGGVSQLPAAPSNTILFQGSEYQYEYQFLGKPAEKAAARALCNGRDPEAIELLAHKQLPESTGEFFQTSCLARQRSGQYMIKGRSEPAW